MNKIEGYGAYQSIFDSALQSKNVKESAENRKETMPNGWESDPVRLERSSKAESKKSVELSDAAQKLLEELKEKYSNMDFMIANYSSDEEAQQLLSRGTKEYSVLIDPETLEKMAADEDTKAQYMNLIDESTSKLDEMKDELKDSDNNITRVGFTIDGNGEVKFFAELEKSSKEQAERIEAKREEKRAEKKEEEKKAQKEKAKEAYKPKEDDVKRANLTASSVEELMDKIKNFNWDDVMKQETIASGSRFDFMA